MAFTRPQVGHGIGLRNEHFTSFLDGEVKLDWAEAIAENFLSDGGRHMAVLERVRRDRPIGLHGVSLSIGGSEPLNRAHLAQWRALVQRFEPTFVSDHLCWGTLGGHYLHDLLPVPYTEEALEHITGRVKQVQDALGRQIMLENVSSYVAYRDSEMTEWQFLAEIARRADCGILLDVNNIVVSAFNHDFQPSDFLAGLPSDRIGQIHLAGHHDKGTHLFDSHGAAVPDAVWSLYEEAVRRFGAVSTLVEWDDEIPALEVVLAEQEKAKQHEAHALAASKSGSTS